MTWLHKPMLRRILMGAAAAFCLALPVQAEGIWSEYAFISSTLGVSDSRICIGEASRGDIGCPSFAPTISPTGRLNASAGLTVDTVSLTTGGTTWGYLGSAGSYLPSLTSSKVSATTISTTAVQVVSATAPLTCDSGKAGTLRYNSTNTALELCTGTGWQMMGVGIPAGTISAFASTTCPTGWSEYTPARGRFLRGIDNGAGNDPDGTRVPGAVQTDLVGNHAHYLRGMQNGDYANFGNSGSLGGWGLAPAPTNNQGSYRLQAGHESSTSHNIGTGAETRPKNVAVLFCRKS